MFNLNTFITVVLPTLLTVLGTVLLFLFKDKAAQRKALIAAMVHDLSQTAHDWDTIEPSALADRIASIAGQVDDALAANGWTPLTKGEKHVVAVRLNGHAGEHKAMKLASAALKATAPVVLLLMCLVAGAARATGFDYSIGPTIPLTELPLATKAPVQLAPGAGLQLSLTHDALKVDIAGKAWDLLDLTVMAFGSTVTGSNGEQFGALSVGGGLGFMSSLFFVGIGTHVLASNEAIQPGQPFLLFALNFNIAIQPKATAGLIRGPEWLPRANTVYLGGGL